MTNPLSDLCARMGLTPETAARLAGMPAGASREALSHDPPPAVAAYLSIAEAIGARLRLRPAPPLAIWLDGDYLDSLYSSGEFRAGRGLPPLPSTRGALRKLVVELRRRGRKSLGEIVSFLQDGYVPTAEGLAEWRRGTVAQHLDSYKRRKGRPLPDDARPLVPGPEAKAAWSDHLVTGLLTEVCPPDPFWCVRFDVRRRARTTAADDRGGIVLENQSPLPEKVREWVLAGFASVPWLAGRWREVEHEMATGETRDVPRPSALP